MGKGGAQEQVVKVKAKQLFQTKQKDKAVKETAGKKQDVINKIKKQGAIGIPGSSGLGFLSLPQEGVRILQPVTRPEEDQLKNKKKKELVEKRRADYQLFGKQMKLTSVAKIHNCSYFTTKIGREDFKKRYTSFLTGEESLEEITADYVAKRILESDYSNFENVDVTMRNVVATMAYRQFKEKYLPHPGMNPKELCQRIKETTEGVTALLNPALRLGLSLAIKSEETEPAMKIFLEKLDEAMSTAVMVETIAHIPKDEDVKVLLREKNPEMPEEELEEKKKQMLEANDAQQIQIAKRLLLMQLSKFEKIRDDGESEDWDKSMAVALSHCSRVVLTFSNVQKNVEGNTEQDHQNLYNMIYRTNGENTAQDVKRTASTHNIFMRKVGTAGPVRTKEKKWYTGNFLNQKGMNCAIGGLGQKGVAGKMLSNDGSCGHFYSMFKMAEEGYHGAMLMGLESDASGMINQMGHKHDWRAKGEHASSLGGQRTDEVGKKYGGRQCDLSHLTAKQITEALQDLETKMREYQRKVRAGEAGTENFRRYLEQLAGGKMDIAN